MSESSTLSVLARELGVSLLPLKERLEQSGFTGLVSELGLQLPPVIAEAPAVVTESNKLIGSLSFLPDNIETLINAIEADNTDQMVSTAITLTNVFVDIVSSINNFATAIDSMSSSGGLTPDEQNQISTFSLELARRLLDFLLIEYFKSKSKGAVATFGLLGILDDFEADSDASSSLQPVYRRRTINFDNLKTLISRPENYLKDVYDFGNSGFNGSKLFPRIQNFLSEVEVDSTIVEPPGLDPFLEAYLFRLSVHEAASALPGIDVRLRLPAVEDFEQTYPLSELWSLVLRAAARFDAGLSLKILPPFDIELQPLAGTVEMDVSGGFVAEKKPDGMTLLSEPGIFRLSLEKVRLTIGVNSKITTEESGVQIEPFAELEIKGGKLNVGSSSGDGFLQTILSGINIESEFGLAGRWKPSTGLLLHGSAGIEVAIPTHIEIGPIQLNTFYLGGEISTDGSPINLETSLGITLTLGPLTGVVERMGVNIGLDFPSDQSGNLGPLDIDIGFKPPNGIGLSIDAGVVKGGGYLYFDFDREEYAGALELVFSELIALKAIGLITTKMPDGSKGFSLLIIITVEFGTGFQLGYGFVLLGVGGLLGLNRVVNIDPLKDGIRTGAVESVMFPKDVIANAPRIISDLRAFFPPQNDIFLVGPMAKIGWGTPTLISVQLGVILEFPSVNITILGVIKVVLPDEEADILRLQVNFIGRFEPSNSLLWFYAELYDSRVLFITLEGGFGLLVNWGDQANFVVSAGGFHPRYNPPPLPFPEPPRIAVNILNESYARVRIEGYFAVTSNSAQFGARAELFFGLSEFRIEGYLGFDALFQFDPFYFSFSISVSLSVKVFGIGLFSVGFSGLLEGPTPWHIEGEGSIGLLFFSISVPFEHTWGQSEDTKLDPIAIYPLLEKELKALTNWTAEVPTSNSLLVSLRQLGESDSDQLVLHPVGKLRISQRKVPINFRMDKLGNQVPSDYTKFTINASLDTGGLSTNEVEERFAIGQYKNLDGSAQLSSPGYEPLESGLEVAVAGSQVKTSQATRRVIRYEQIIIDNNFRRYIKKFYKYFESGLGVLNEFLFAHFLKGNAVSKSALSQNYKKKLKPFDEVIEVNVNKYSVAFNSDNKAIDPAAIKFSSQAKANEFMQQQIKADVSLKNRLHVIPNTELNKVA